MFEYTFCMTTELLVLSHPLTGWPCYLKGLTGGGGTSSGARFALLRLVGDECNKHSSSGSGKEGQGEQG